MSWLAPPLYLLAVLAGAWVVFARPLPLFGGVLAFLAVVPALWVLVSALWPAKAERRCPQCRALGLERLDRRATHGLRCRACGWRDEHASAWLLAEEDGRLEEIVLAERARRGATSPVDRPPRAG